MYGNPMKLLQNWFNVIIARRCGNMKCISIFGRVVTSSELHLQSEERYNSLILMKLESSEER